MQRRFSLALVCAAVVIATSAFIGGSLAAPPSNALIELASPDAPVLTKVQYACGWTYSCTNLGNGGNGPQNVQIYGPVNVYTGGDIKPEIWRVPEGAWPWTGGQESASWRGIGCGGYPCDEKCGAFCWFNRVRNGYCGHGCDVYREHVMFQPINGTLRPYVYQDPPYGDYGFGSASGYAGGYGCGYGGGRGSARCARASAGYGSGGGYSQTSVQQGYGSAGYNGYGQPPAGYSQNAPQDYGAPAPSGERFIDRLRRYFYGSPRPNGYGDTAAVRDNGAVRFERPSNDLVPLRRFNGPKYPPTSDGGSKSYGAPK